MSRTSKIALSGILGAAAVLIMMGTVLPAGIYALPALAGLLLIPIIKENGLRWAWLTYMAVGLLSLLLTPSMEAKLALVGFFGYYPCYKVLVERLPRIAAWILKLALISGVLVAMYTLTLMFMELPEDFFGGLPWLFFPLAIVAYLLYDRAITVITELYMRTLHERLRR